MYWWHAQYLLVCTWDRHIHEQLNTNIEMEEVHTLAMTSDVRVTYISNDLRCKSHIH